MDIRKLKNVMEKIPEHYINKMQEKYLTLRPYDLEKYLSKKPAKKGLLYETDRYRNFIKFLKENNVNNKFYLKLNEGIDLVVVSDNLDLIQEIVMHLYSCKKKNNLEALSNFIFENKADIENDIQADLNIVEAPGVKHINSYIDKVIHFTLTKDSVTEDMINFLFNGKCEIPIDSRKHIVKNIYSTIDKSIMDELDRNLKNFKQAMQYTLIAKVITGLKDTESYDIPNEKSINITEGLEGDTVTKTSNLNLSPCEVRLNKIDNCTMPKINKIFGENETIELPSLSTADGIATKVVIDSYLDFQTHKMDSALTDKLSVDKDIIKGLLSDYRNDQVGLKETVNNLFKLIEGQLLDHKEIFKKLNMLLSDYLYLIHPISGFRIEKSERYTLEKNLGCKIVATKNWVCGETLFALIGYLAAIDKKSVLKYKAFSIFYNSISKEHRIYLGPGSYVNHDCEPNSKYLSLSRNKVALTVIKPINAGDEITVFYGENYFGEGNKECECRTCEFHNKGEDRYLFKK